VTIETKARSRFSRRFDIFFVSDFVEDKAHADPLAPARMTPRTSPAAHKFHDCDD